VESGHASIAQSSWGRGDQLAGTIRPAAQRLDVVPGTADNLHARMVKDIRMRR
jgi:hypothetical protein